MDGQDSDIAGSVSQSIERVVELRTGCSVRELRVDVHEHSIVLLGRTSTYYAKQLASHAALDAVDDRDEITLSNQIEVT